MGGLGSEGALGSYVAISVSPLPPPAATGFFTGAAIAAVAASVTVPYGATFVAGVATRATASEVEPANTVQQAPGSTEHTAPVRSALTRTDLCHLGVVVEAGLPLTHSQLVGSLLRGHQGEPQVAYERVGVIQPIHLELAANLGLAHSLGIGEPRLPRSRIARRVPAPGCSVIELLLLHLAVPGELFLATVKLRRWEPRLQLLHDLVLNHLRVGW